ncbi:class II fructose-bisphosphatase [Thermoflexus sp.]|uniref:class II fructose-bisphosphatase n=1 Tax=Thermoflexus sp. TaxID=1969742 RepID=UPI0025D0D675|nr:class II fructose-bisphosphatase [Thermoflexus sp.]MDW8181579.1 class II fructose-bisphosphatase [Anaerolineae bacterium]MCS6962729.1 class II fructose-bisphosphatase [Thermoflexus sp.]MCS7352120.1 class II fructose-bisphosphatase [Thermoflexus sp.]MCX7690028.1 class II fructose-bisphosphatase [Thermoflexus sp.]MDW8184047.1 class II fructose-bisphosphatase [Anaerolineae bacterium]
MAQEPDRNLALELVRVTEAAALAAGRWMGRGDRNAADRAAVEAMRLMLRSIDMDGVVVIGEGEKDEAPMLYNGERIGNGRPPEVDVAVDPIDGTRLLALGRPGAIAVVALSERGTMFSPGRIVYMNKLAVGPEAREVIDLDAPIAENLRRIARAKGKDVDDLTVVILERDRHADLIREVRAAGARIKLITDGDVSAALMTAFPDSGIDVLVGIGGSPEAVITAAALKCLGGEIHARLWPRNEEERRFAAEMGYDLQQVLTADDLVQGDNIFFAATGITDGEILRGVRYTGDGARTHSVVMRSRSGTIRFVEAYHRWDKLMRISGYPYDRGAGEAPPPAR